MKTVRSLKLSVATSIIKDACELNNPILNKSNPLLEKIAVRIIKNKLTNYQLVDLYRDLHKDAGIKSSVSQYI